MKTIVSDQPATQDGQVTYGSVIGRFKAWQQNHKEFCYWASMAWRIPAALVLVVYLLCKLLAPYIKKAAVSVQDMYTEDREMLFAAPIILVVALAYIGLERHLAGLSVIDQIAFLDWWTVRLFR